MTCEILPKNEHLRRVVEKHWQKVIAVYGFEKNYETDKEVNYRSVTYVQQMPSHFTLTIGLFTDETLIAWYEPHGGLVFPRGDKLDSWNFEDQVIGVVEFLDKYHPVGLVKRTVI